MAYSEPAKKQARELVINNAVRILTTDRSKASLARRTYVREAREYLRTEGTPSDKAVAARLSDATVERWERFFDSIVQKRKPSKLKVAYLSGPTPENDLRVFCDAGILPENIWAFESDALTYSAAVQSALSSEFPFVKLVQSGIDTFLTTSPQKFDIFYLDFCGPLPNRDKKQKTLLAVTRLLAKHALNSPGALITNAALPTKAQDERGRHLLTRLVAAYLYPKDFLELKGNAGGFIEGPRANGLDFEAWLDEVDKNLDDYYGQYLTRMIMDHVSVIAPACRVALGQGVFTRLFDTTNEAALRAGIDRLFHFNEAFLSQYEDCDLVVSGPDVDEGSKQDDSHFGGDVITEPGDYPILWSLAALDAQVRAGDENYPMLASEPDFRKFADLFISQLSAQNDKNAVISSVAAAAFLLSEGTGSEKFYSSNLEQLSKAHRFDKFYQFCDLFLFHQLKELLLRQLTVPYHVNVKETMRWTYTAKETPMFMDLFVLDECRYVYDWMPTVDMLLSGVSDDERQLSFRFALDGISKHGRWYSTEYFRGTAVIDQSTKPFEAQRLLPRTHI